MECGAHSEPSLSLEVVVRGEMYSEQQTKHKQILAQKGMNPWRNPRPVFSEISNSSSRTALQRVALRLRAGSTMINSLCGVYLHTGMLESWGSYSLRCESRYIVSVRLKSRLLLCERLTFVTSVWTTVYGSLVSQYVGRMVVTGIAQLILLGEAPQLSHFLI
jgi:hypothetical protein